MLGRSHRFLGITSTFFNVVDSRMCIIISLTVPRLYTPPYIALFVSFTYILWLYSGLFLPCVTSFLPCFVAVVVVVVAALIFKIVRSLNRKNGGPGCGVLPDDDPECCDNRDHSRAHDQTGCERKC